MNRLISNWRGSNCRGSKSRVASVTRLAAGLALSCVVTGVVAGAGNAVAGEKDFLIYAPGAGGSPEQAKPYLDTLFGYLEKKLGWPAKSGGGEYVDDAKAADEYLDKTKPGFGLLSPEFYLRLSCKKVPMTVLARVVGDEVAGEPVYHVVVKSDKPYKTLEDLKGKKLVSNHLHDPKFVSRLIFDGKLDVEKFFATQPTLSPIKPFKSVDRDEADAALVSDAQLKHIKKEMPALAGKLRTVFTSAALPPYPVVAFDKAAPTALREQVKKALREMCSSKEGAEVCKSLTINRIEAIDAKTFAPAIDRYCQP